MQNRSVIATLLGIVGIVAVQLIQGGSLLTLIQIPALVLVLMGTLGAMMLSFPFKDVSRAFSQITEAYTDDDYSAKQDIAELTRIADVARKDGVLALDAVRAEIKNPFTKKILKFVIDGFDPKSVDEVMRTEIDHEFKLRDSAGQVFEVAGAYAPTVGVIAAVLGLMRVMVMLNDVAKLGDGIASSLVAMLYGLALSVFLFLPWGNHLRQKALLQRRPKELIRVGIMGIQEGLSPMFLSEKLKTMSESLERELA